MDKSNQMLPYTCLVLAMVLWASTFVALKLAFSLYDPMVVIFGRMAVASLLAVFFPFVFKNIQFRMEDLKYIIFMVICEPCLYFVFEAKALVYTSAAQAGMITSMMPLMVAIGAGLILKEKLTLKTYLGFIIAVMGALWLSFASNPSLHGPRPLLGNFLEFIAMVCATGYALSMKKLTSHYSPLFLTFIQAFAGAIFFFPALFLPGTELPVQAEPVPVFAILYLGSAVTLGAYGFYNYGVSKIPASQATAFINLIPVFSLAMSALVLGERFSSVQYMASVLVFIGVLLSQNFKGGKQTSTAPLPEG
jgi:drug/metabolite transporter (DMT)-like permease